MLPTPHIVARYAELHREALRSEVHRDRLAATCRPDASKTQRTTSRVWSAASSLLTSLLGESLPGRHATGKSNPATRGAL
jgi:hypothetical protein